MVTSSPNGRVFRPKSAQKLVLFLKNLELAKPDVWGTNMLIAWLQQVFEVKKKKCQGEQKLILNFLAAFVQRIL